MEEAYNLNKTARFVNPTFDMFFLAGFPIVFIIIFLVYFLYKHFSTLLVYDYLYTALTFPHILAGFSAVYIYRREIKEKSLQFIWLPLVFISVIITFVILQNYKELEITRISWGTLHLLLQAYCIIGLYKLRNNDYAKLDKVIDASFLIMVHSDYEVRRLPFILKEYFGRTTPVIDTSTAISVPFLKNYWGPFIWFIVIAFILRQVYLFFRYKKIYPFKILMFSAIFICYFYLLIITREFLVARAGLIGLHNIQWISWVWFYHRQKFKEGIMKGAKVISYIFQPGHVRLYLSSLVLISLLFNFLLTFRIPLHAPLIRTFFALLHFLIEAIIWKASGMRRVIAESA